VDSCFTNAWNTAWSPSRLWHGKYKLEKSEQLFPKCQLILTYRQVFIG